MSRINLPLGNPVPVRFPPANPGWIQTPAGVHRIVTTDTTIKAPFVVVTDAPPHDELPPPTTIPYHLYPLNPPLPQSPQPYQMPLDMSDSALDSRYTPRVIEIVKASFKLRSLTLSEYLNDEAIQLLIQHRVKLTTEEREAIADLYSHVRSRFEYRKKQILDSNGADFAKQANAFGGNGFGKWFNSIVEGVSDAVIYRDRVTYDEKFHTDVMNTTCDATFQSRDDEAWNQIITNYIKELDVRMLKNRNSPSARPMTTIREIESEQTQRRKQLDDEQLLAYSSQQFPTKHSNLKNMTLIDQIVTKENEKMVDWAGKKAKRILDCYRICQTVWLGNVDLLLAGYTNGDKYVTKARRTYLYSLKDEPGEPPSYLGSDFSRFSPQDPQLRKLQYKEAPPDPRDEEYVFMGRTEYIDRNLQAWVELARRPIKSGTSMSITKQADPDSFISIDPSSGKLVQIPCIVNDQWRWLHDPDTGTLYCPKIIFQYIKMIIHEFRIINLIPSIKKIRDAQDILYDKVAGQYEESSDTVKMSTIDLDASISETLQMDPTYSMLIRMNEILQRAGGECIERIININKYFSLASANNSESLLELTQQLKDFFEFSARHRATSNRVPETAAAPAANSHQTNSEGLHTSVLPGPGGTTTTASKPSESPIAIADDGERAKLATRLSLRRKITIAENIRLVQLVDGKSISAFEHVILSRAFNFYAENSIMLHAKVGSNSSATRSNHGVLLSHQGLKELAYIQCEYVSINLEPNGDSKETNREKAIGTNDLEGTYLARHYPYLFFLLIKFFAMPFLDIKLADKETSNENASESPLSSTTATATKQLMSNVPNLAQHTPVTATAEEIDIIHGYITEEARRLSDRYKQDLEATSKPVVQAPLASPMVITYTDCTPSPEHMILWFDEENGREETGTGGTSFPEWVVK